MSNYHTPLKRAPSNNKGGLIRNLNTIIDFWEVPCSIPWEVWVRTALPALVPVLIDLVTPGKIEVLKMPLGRYHGLGGKAIRRAYKKYFPGAVAAAEGNYLWKILRPIERVLFWWMIADLVTDFLANWMSMAYRSQGCSPDHMTCQLGQTLPNPFNGASGDVGSLWNTINDPDNMSTVNGILIPAGKTGSVGVALNAKAWLGQPMAGISCSVIDGFSGSTYLTTGDAVDEGVGVGAMEWKTKIPALGTPRWFVPIMHLSGGIEAYVDIEGSSFTGSAS